MLGQERDERHVFKTLTFTWNHPSYYRSLKRQAAKLNLEPLRLIVDPQPQAASDKLQAPSTEGSSVNLRSNKRQASSRKRQAQESESPHKVSSI